MYQDRRDGLSDHLLGRQTPARPAPARADADEKDVEIAVPRHQLAVLRRHMAALLKGTALRFRVVTVDARSLQPSPKGGIVVPALRF